MIRLAVAGATGQMGRCVLEMAAGDERFTIAAALSSAQSSRAGSMLTVGDRNMAITQQLEAACDVLVDFSLPSGTMAWLEVCERRTLPMVIGVTGHQEHQLRRIHEAARAIPILHAVNFSPGIQAILGLIGPLAQSLGRAYDVEIVETHHRDKIDAPSGTALVLAEAIAANSGRASEQEVVFGRQGRVGPRPPGQIGVHSVRMGDLTSQHDVHFAGSGETITIRHVVHSRAPFAVGALRAAVWIVSKPPGLYTMNDVSAIP